MPQYRKAGILRRDSMMKCWIVAIAGLCCATGLLHAQEDDPAANFGIIPTRSVWSGVYSAAQASRGEYAYSNDECGSCHDEVGGGSGDPELVGANFLEDWDGQSALELARHIHSSTMGNPGDIGIAEATDLIAFLLQENQIPAGNSDLSVDPRVLAGIRIEEQNPAAK
jgi:hypothetical protein